MRAIHGGKAEDDDSDAEKIGRLLRGGNIPYAHVDPKGMGETRDLLRRRNYFVRRGVRSSFWSIRPQGLAVGVPRQKARCQNP
jgi:hypothetical protein